MTKATKKTAALVSILCLGSGMAGLVYETLWIRVLSLGVGSTSSAMSVVLSIFFFGLSLGSVIAGKKIDGIKNPLFVYGLVEGLLGLYGAAVIFPLMHFQSLIAFFGVSSLSLTGSFLKFLWVFLLLLLPSLCMGATLPLLVKLFVDFGHVGRNLSRLYALNTLGAVLGAFITGFVLIPKWGVLNANLLAALLSLTVSLIAILYSARLGERRLPWRSLDKSSGLSWGKTLLIENTQQRLLLFSCALTGFVSVACEVVWTKYLGIYFGTNIYGLGLVLSIYLLGIALGSALLGVFIERIKNKFNFYLGLLLASSVLIAFSSHLLARTPEWVVGFSQLTHGYFSLLFLKAFMSAFILFFPTALFGALFPLGMILLSSDRSKAPAVVGLAYALNTGGAILGSYLAGIVLIPTVGSGQTLVVAALCPLAMVWVLFESRLEKVRTRIAFAVLVVSSVFGIIRYGQFDFTRIIRSAYHQESRLASHLRDGEEFELVLEGETGVISLSHDPRDGEGYKNYLRLKTNGLNESVYDMENLSRLPKYEALIGLLPYVFSPNPKRAFVVGYGGGFTVDLLTGTDLEEVHVVELEKGILKAADFVYAKKNQKNPLLQRKNLHLQIEDARYVLASGQMGKLDLIVSQPSHSWVSGAANLFTREFFQVVRSNLSQQGVFSQWLNLYNMDVDVLKSLLKTFYEVFPYGAVFTERGDDELVLIGSQQPLDLNLLKLDSLAQNPLLKNKLSNVFKSSPYDLLSLYSLSRKEVQELTRNSPTNTDSNAYAEVHQSAIFYEGLKGRETPQNYLSSVFKGDYSSIVQASDGVNPYFYDQLLSSMNENGIQDKLFVVLQHFELASKNRADWARLGYFCLRAQRYPSALAYLKKAFRKKANLTNLNLILASLTEMERYAEVVDWVRANGAVRDRVTECYLAGGLVGDRQLKEADSLVAKLVQDVPGYTQACGDYYNKIVGQYYLAKHNAETAIPFLEAYYGRFPSDLATVKMLVSAYHAKKDRGNGVEFSRYLTLLANKEGQRLNQMVEFFEGAGLKEDAKILAIRSLKLNKFRGQDPLAE